VRECQPVTTYELLREAILGRRQVWAVYHGLPRAFCPHILGAKGSERHCLGYQFAGESTSGAITPGSPDNWRCFAVDGLSFPAGAGADQPAGLAGSWRGDPRLGQQVGPQQVRQGLGVDRVVLETCVERIEVEVEGEP